MRIGFDFDKVFVNYPPFVPDFIIDWLYKNKNHHLSYRIPGRLEQEIRILSHHPLLRPPIRENINVLSKLAGQKKHEIYLVSGRFGFLKKRTEKWVKKHKIDTFFKELNFNFSNKQPHFFKLEMIKKLKIKHFIDDDLDLLIFLSEKLKDVRFYWLNQRLFFSHTSLPNNITVIKNLSEFEKNFLETTQNKKNNHKTISGNTTNPGIKVGNKTNKIANNNYSQLLVQKNPQAKAKFYSK